MEALETAGIVLAIVVLGGVRAWEVVHRVRGLRRAYARLRPIRPEDRDRRRREREERRREREERQRVYEGAMRRYGPRDQR